jgi:tRNA(Ile)-lysidine synthase TilS/MesJ
MKHEILCRPWEVPTQAGHIQEAARKHRYTLLYEKCKAEGINNLLTAHQLEVGFRSWLKAWDHSELIL